jgi:S-layer family protein
MRGPLYVSLAVAAAIAGALPSPAGAQQVRAGAEFRANSYTTNSQRAPDVLIQPNGDFIVAWAGENAGLDTDAYGIIGQRYDVLGAPVGGEFRVNTFTPSYQFRPILASDAKSNFVVVWSSYTQDGDYYGMFGQRFAADGSPRGGEFMVNTYTTGGQGASFYFFLQNHAVSMAPNGNFVVVWGSYGADQDGDGPSIHGQRFDANGVRQGTEFLVNTNTTGYQISPTVAMNADSSFVVVWTTEDSYANYGVVGQRYDPNGAPVGGEFQIPDTTAAPLQVAPVVRAAADKSFVVSWLDAGEQVAKRFSPTGAPIGAQFQVNTPEPGNNYAYSFGMDKRGNFVVNWNNHADPAYADIGGRRFTAAGTAREPDSTVNLFTANVQNEAASTSDEVGNVLSAWTDQARDGSQQGIYVQRFGGLRPAALNVDTAGNRVLDPGETAAITPSWRNVNGAPQTFGGTLSAFTGPTGFTYTITDPTATYGTVANAAIAPCTDCYGVSVDNPPTRPTAHVDASAVESITPDTQGQQKVWSLHIGRSFTDVPPTNGFYRFIETLLHNSITGGCTPTTYCPAANSSREQMSVFVLVAKEGPTYLPPACVAGSEAFTDVPATSPFCRWIEELARRGVVGGCGAGLYCPTANVTREQMAVFVLRTLDPALTPPACAPPNLFADVPESSPFCRWVEELANRSIVSGCGGGNYCPTAPVTREQMGVFISATFSLTLYGI